MAPKRSPPRRQSDQMGLHNRTGAATGERGPDGFDVDAYEEHFHHNRNFKNSQQGDCPSRIGLEDAFSRACCSLTPDRLRALRRAGVPEAALFNPLMVGVAPISPHRGGLFDIVDDGDLAILVPAGEHNGLNWQLEDIVAFRLDRPERWWRRRGVADVLGRVDGFSVEPRRLHRHPLDWLKDAGHGLCVLNWKLDPVDLLMGAGRLVADQHIAKKLRAAVHRAAAESVGNLIYG